ncbi:Similar to CDA1: Chitin deacetylase 1 (Bombyx mori) [Cotesia congregata]|uniref:Similar to CDA1: Chitin deacetylase 1 (Bombyx mori) n=1 Tax=Cotesia congregata TaxID=51543 RepID=A0A8J2MN64_COTCN|nr:Similar to CDA1: Chitin deacetylase 1 (Bombyx mori) [Cotesia congregata]
MKSSIVIFLLVTTLAVIHGENVRVKRQEESKKDESFESEICKDKDAGEWFRLVAGEGDNCRDVIQCTSSGLQAIRCPAGLYFDIDKQTCDWKGAVNNCKLKNKERKAKPLLVTEEPLCQDGFLACADTSCIERGLFCNGEKDCTDGSDENSCDMDNDPNRAPPCDPAVCVLPDCFCSEDGTTIPGDLPSKDVPQMITITFDDAINNNNIGLYKEIFNGKRKNPNGCDIKATFFVSHKYTNYSAVQEMHRKGHEIAVHSISHNDDERFWSDATVDEWAKEMAGMRIIAEKYANLTDNSVVGVRAPYLRVGGNNQFTMMEEQAFLYDSTITAALNNPPLWPYTMYFRMPHRCHGNLQHCPTRSHAVWEMVMNELDRREDPQNDEYLPGCAMVDSCSNILSGDQFYNFLNHNFDRHYDQNRAPLGLYFHAAWLKNNPEYLDAFLYWIDEILANHNDVYFVTMTQVIQWIQNPRTVTESKNFEPWKEKCVVDGPPACWVPHTCKLTSKEVPGETINLQSCVRCPNNYPWLNDPTGDGFF